MLAQIPERKDVPNKDKWNLSKLFCNDEAWDKALIDFNNLIPQISKFKGTLSSSKEALLEALDFYKKYSMLCERLSYYAELRETEDEGNSSARERMGNFMISYTKGSGAWSFFIPEIQKIDDKKISEWMNDKSFSEYKIYLSRIIRVKPHVLSENEERLLALSADASGTAQNAFSVLTNVDLDFGTVETKDGKLPLSQSTFSSFMRSDDRDLRQRAYLQFYNEFDAHKNTIAELYAGQCKMDCYHSSVRNYSSTRASALFDDDVPETVYDNLVSTVGDNLSTLHDYYSMRKKVLKLQELRHYDVYVPLVGQVKVKHTWEESVEIIRKALNPLGEEYVNTLCAGLLGGWADRYENKGKRSGAFSAGSYSGEPYILMNYKDEDLRHVFTMAHEGGHSMHSYYSIKSNPFMNYNYTIFEAEVASTFNEALVFEYMLKNAESEDVKTYLLANRVDDILATLFRQTMFAEFEHKAHVCIESGQALTLDTLRSTYRKLLEKYFGPEMVFEEQSDLEGLRIPHFYNSYYVYKYATGVSASIALSKRVLEGGKAERDDYFKFLCSGGSRFPIESLKIAGVDMSSPEPVKEACNEFARLVSLLKKSLNA